MKKSVTELLAEMDAAAGAPNFAAHKRPADQHGNGEPLTAAKKEPGTDEGGGDPHANRPRDQSNNGEVTAPLQGSSQPGDGTKTPLNPDEHAFDDEPEPIANFKPVNESDFTVKFVKADFGGLFEAEGITEDFTTKAIVIFEAAVNNAVKKKIAELNTHGSKYFTEQVAEVSTALAEQVDNRVAKYLDHVVTEWVTENKIAIESGMKVQLAENMLQGMQSLFAENFVTVPEAKVDLVEGLGNQVKNLETQLAEAVENNVNMTKMLKEAAKDVEILSFTKGLTAVKADRVRELAESVEFTTPTEFRMKLKTIAEGLTMPTKAPASDASMIAEDNGKPLNENAPVRHEIPEMSAYLNTSAAIQRK